jgi:hypothetical protein
MATSNGFQVSGKIAEIHPEKQFGKLTKQDFVIDFNDGKYDQTLRFELIGDRVSPLPQKSRGPQPTGDWSPGRGDEDEIEF